MEKGKELSKKRGHRADFSDYLVHFTADSAPHHEATKDYAQIAAMSAKDRLMCILKGKKIKASLMRWTNKPAVCFTECPWTSLLEHTKKYSPYGIGFSKPFIFSRNGSPVYYVRADQYKKQKWHEHLHQFVTPFWPEYTPKTLWDEINFPLCDYTHEREWRVPHDLPFEYNQIEFVVLNDYKDMAQFPQELKDAIGRDKFILMDNYKLIEKLWPVHQLGLN